MKMLDIGEVVAISGVPASTLRYYEELRLISSSGRHGLRRQYGPDVILRLALIDMGRSAGFSLKETAAMFGADGIPDMPRDDLHRRADMLEQKALEILNLATMMRHVADCPAPSHLECPNFRKLLRVGVRHQSRMRKLRKKSDLRSRR